MMLLQSVTEERLISYIIQKQALIYVVNRDGSYKSGCKISAI